MYSRWYNVAVVLLWLATMSWLVVDKVVPPLLIGDPPNRRTILEAKRHEPPVGWKIAFNQRSLGWALSTTTRQPSGLTEIGSRVHFDEVPLGELIPNWLRGLMRLGDLPLGELQMDAESNLVVDALGQLSRFQSTVRLAPLDNLVKLSGEVEQSKLNLTARWGDAHYTTEVPLPKDALPNDALSPQTQLPGLRKGQTWPVPVYSPLSPGDPLEILSAAVVGREPVLYDGRTENAWLVIYHSDPGSGLSSNEKARGRLWVRADGTVLKQQVMVLGSTVTFMRLSKKQTALLEKRAAESQPIDGRISPQASEK